MQRLPLDQDHLPADPTLSISKRCETYLWLFLIFANISNALAQSAVLIPADSHENQAFGSSVAISGNALAATAGNSTYVFRFNGTTWTQEQFIEPGGHENTALEGNVLAVPNDTFACNIYRYNGAVWQFEQAVQEPAGQPDLNGRAALSGNHLLLGAWGPRAYVYQFNAGSWSHAQTFSIPAANKTTVALREDYLAVGGDQMVSVFHYDGAQWQLDATLAPPGPHIHFDIDYPLALDPPYLMVGHLQANGEAAVRVYSNTSGSWNVLQDLQSPALASSIAFGYAISIDDEMAVIGTPQDFGGHGEAWLLRLCDGLWRPEQHIVTPTGTADHFFAASVAIEDGKAVVGAPYHYTSAGFGAGKVYVYDAPVDCNLSGIGDGCELTAPNADCDHDFVLDQCQPFLDCNSNTRRDACDIADATSADCNQTGSPDECDIAAGTSVDSDFDGVPDECFEIACPPTATEPVYSLKAVSRNGQRVPPSNSIAIMPGDQIDADIYTMCWGTQVHFLQTYEASIDVLSSATSGDYGAVLPLGWDFPGVIDICPCTNPDYPTCSPAFGCVGADHDPERGASLDFLRPDFLLFGHSAVTAIDVSNAIRIRWGGTIFGDEIILDDGLARYCASLRLVAGDNACGAFEYNFAPEYSYLEDSTKLGTFPYAFFPRLESLTINVCANDGLFCNGLESCDSQLGCQITPPLSCNDGVACTIDSCNEVTDGCTNALNHGACDDGEFCTRDECTPTGCVHIDDQCGDIPTTSHWGLAVLALCLLIGGKLRASRYRVIRGE